MKIKALDCFAHATGSFVIGREYQVLDSLGLHFIDAHLAEEIKPVEAKQEAKPEAKKAKE